MRRQIPGSTIDVLPLLLGLIIPISGCSSSSLVRSTSEGSDITDVELNQVLEGKEGDIELNSGKLVFAREMIISGDSLSWIEMQTNDRSVAKKRELTRVVIKDHWLGGLEGFGFGFLTGAAIGALSTSSKDYNFFGHEAQLLLGAAGGIAGGLLGGATGLLVGHRKEYRFVEGGLPSRIVIEESHTKGDVVHLANGDVVQGIILEILFETPGTKTIRRYVRQGSIPRNAIITELQNGSTLKHVIIRNEQGENKTYIESEIERINMAD